MNKGQNKNSAQKLSFFFSLGFFLVGLGPVLRNLSCQTVCIRSAPCDLVGLVEIGVIFLEEPGKILIFVVIVGIVEEVSVIALVGLLRWVACLACV